ncbi:MAG: adenylate/guanylate cyclase domain-containing protein [Elainellaceae cyanobacterium]
MVFVPLLPNESERLADLFRHNVLDTPPDQDFNEITELTALLCNAEIAFVNLVDDHRQWCKASVGIDLKETPRDIAFCAHALLEDDIFEIPDATKDKRFYNNPLVVNEPHIRFYAGQSLRSIKGHALGSLCVLDRHSRRLTSKQRFILKTLAKQVERLLELRLRIQEQNESLRLIQQQQQSLLQEKERSEKLLLSIFPKTIAEQLKVSSDRQSAIESKFLVECFNSATVLFADIVNFTEISSQCSPNQIVRMLNEVFSRFDQLANRYQLEKIKTIGDAYMVAGGLPHLMPCHIEAVANMALDIQTEIQTIFDPQEQPIVVRMGIHTGEVMAGVIGRQKFIYDLWGDAVNMASRMESQGLPGKIQVTGEIYDALGDRYFLEQRGLVAVKGKGDVMTYWLNGRR